MLKLLENHLWDNQESVNTGDWLLDNYLGITVNCFRYENYFAVMLKN